MKQLLVLLLIICCLTTTFAQIKTSEVEVESRDDTEITGNLNLIQGDFFMEDENPRISFQETDESNKNFWIQLVGGKLNFYEVDDNDSFEARLTLNATNNRVGINQVNPQYTLDVEGSVGANSLSLNFTNPHINFYENDQTNKNWLIQANNGNLGFWTKDDDNSNAQQRITFTNAGRVGINNTNPSQPLHVNGTARIDGDPSASLRMSELDDPEGNWSMGASAGRLRLSVANSTWDSFQHKLVIRGSSGFIGINNDNPSQQLHVNGNLHLANDNSYIRFQETDQATDSRWQVAANGGKYRIYAMETGWNVLGERFTIKHNSGFVGIGTTDPTSRLQVMGGMRLEAPNVTVKFDETDELNGHWAMTANGGRFRIYQVGEDWSSASYVDKFTITGSNGFVGINNVSPTAQLHVNGTIKAPARDWSDFVFDDGYELPTLDEVEEHIATYGHLKDIPSEEEVMRDDVDLTSMDAKLLQKIEELTLYLIEQNKRIEELEQKLADKED